MHRKDDDARGAAPGADHLRRFGAVHLRHRLVHHHHVGLGVDRAAHRIESIVGDGHHLHVALSVDQRAQAVGDDAVIIRQQHLDRHSAILTVRRVPPAASAPTGSGSTLNAPPTAWARSRIVTRPSPGRSGACADFGRPMPSSAIDITSSDGERDSLIATCSARACFPTLVSASCAMRNSAISTSAGGRWPSSPACTENTTPVRRVDRLAYHSIPAGSPWSSSIGRRGRAAHPFFIPAPTFSHAAPTPSPPPGSGT